MVKAYLGASTSVTTPKPQGQSAKWMVFLLTQEQQVKNKGLLGCTLGRTLIFHVAALLPSVNKTELILETHGEFEVTVQIC